MAGDGLPPDYGKRPRSATLRIRAWRRFLPWGIASFLLLGVLLSWEAGMDCCAECGSYRDLGSVGLGIRSKFRPLVVLYPNEPIRPTLAMEDFFPEGHEHEWRMSCHHLGGLPGTLFSPYACFGLYRNAFANAYEEVGALREFVLGEIGAGRTTREEVLGMLHLPRSRPWIDSDEQRVLRARAFGWMKEHAPAAPDFYMDGSRYRRDGTTGSPALEARSAAEDMGQRATEDTPK